MQLKFDFLLSQCNSICVHHPSQEGAARRSSAVFHRLGAGAERGVWAAEPYLCCGQRGLVCQVRSRTSHGSDTALEHSGASGGMCKRTHTVGRTDVWNPAPTFQKCLCALNVITSIYAEIKSKIWGKDLREPLRPNYWTKWSTSKNLPNYIL